MSDILVDGDNGATYMKSLPQMFAFGKFARDE
jgi:hypothetical protein